MTIIRRLMPLLVLLAGTLIAFAIYSNKPEAKHRPVRPKTLTVEAIAVKPQDFSVTIRAQGSVEARTTSTLIPRVSGEIVKVSSTFRPGGFFEAGDVLVTIDPTDYQLAMKSSQAAMAEARFNLQEEQARAEQAIDNWKRLGRTGVANDLVLRKPQLARARASVESAEAQLQRAQLDLKRTQIVAPYVGRILEQFADIGQYVSPGNEVAKIYAVDYAEIRLPLTEKQRGMLALPQPYRGESGQTTQSAPKAIITASISGNKHTWTGKVIRTEGSIDRSTRQIFVVVQVDNPYGRQKPERPPLEIGRFVTAKIQGKVFHNVFVLPRTAVQGQNTIMIVDKNSLLQRRQIAVLWETQDAIVIRGGIEEDERLCTTYVPFVANNVKVAVASDRGSKTRTLSEKKETPATPPKL